MKLRIGFGLTAICFVLSALTCLADEPGDVRGCYVTYLSGNGKFLYEPFLKVANKENVSDEGEAEIWGFRPWNLETPDEHGKTHPVNINEGRFIPLGVFKEVKTGTATRRIKCPDGLW